MQSLRDPSSGCPWDLEQTFQSLVPYTLEEAYEVVDAIERNNMEDIKSELGDLLFQIVFYCQLGNEQGSFDIEDVAQSICDKLIRRHPHVFADKKITNAEQQTREWEKIKQQEREEKAAIANKYSSHLDDVSRTLPSLKRAEKIQKRVAREGFDWTNIAAVLQKVKEELNEVEEELEAEAINNNQLEDEIGDLFFSCVNLSRHAGFDAEMCLRKANLKFESRYRAVEQKAVKYGLRINEMQASELENLWREVKLGEN